MPSPNLAYAKAVLLILHYYALRLSCLSVVSQHPARAYPKGLSVAWAEHRDAGGYIPEVAQRLA